MEGTDYLDEWNLMDSSRKVVALLSFQLPLLDFLPLEDILGRFFGFSGHFQASINISLWGNFLQFLIYNFRILKALKIKTFLKFATESFGSKKT